MNKDSSGTIGGQVMKTWLTIGPNIIVLPTISKKRPMILTPKIVLEALRASTNRTPATLGKGLAKTGITIGAVTIA